MTGAPRPCSRLSVPPPIGPCSTTCRGVTQSAPGTCAPWPKPWVRAPAGHRYKVILLRRHIELVCMCLMALAAPVKSRGRGRRGPVYAAASLTDALKELAARLREGDRAQGRLQPRRLERPRPADQGGRAGRRLLLRRHGADGRPRERGPRPRAGPGRRALERARRRGARGVLREDRARRPTSWPSAHRPGGPAGRARRRLRAHLAPVPRPVGTR